MNHTIPVSITGGRLPVNTSVQVLSEFDTAGTYKFQSLSLFILLCLLHCSGSYHTIATM